MEVAASNTPNNQTSQLNDKDTIGERKGDTALLTPWLQDVFSDSANPVGRQTKTSWPSDTEREKEAQLHKKVEAKSKSNRKGGRKKLDQSKRKAIKLQLHVTEHEYIKILNIFQASGRKTIADFLRDMVLNEKQSKAILNRTALIKQLDYLGKSLGRIGNNINQLAKYANIQLKSGKTDPKTMERFTVMMDKYMQERRELTKAYRALVRK